jgi:hypothetical protein
LSAETSSTIEHIDATLGHAQRIALPTPLTASADDQLSIDLLVQFALFQFVRGWLRNLENIDCTRLPVTNRCGTD